MRRRSFLQSCSLAAAAQEIRRTAAPVAAANFNQGKPWACFGEEGLTTLVGTPRPLQKRPFVIAYYFPSWHATPVMEKWLGQGWTEFQTLHDTRTLFPGHQMPNQPLWGYCNEADPQWAEREIETALNYGLDGWMVDW